MFTPKDMLGDTELLGDDLIESRVGVHDSEHFEVKLDYAIKPTGRSRYNVDYYFFVPTSLGINRHTYEEQQFFSDIQAYIRFKTPSLNMKSLLKEQDSSLAEIAESIRKLRIQPQNKLYLQELMHQLRMFACILRARVRDRTRSLRDTLVAVLEGGAEKTVLLQDATSICRSIVLDIEDALQKWRLLRPSFVDGRLPQFACETFCYADEYMSLIVETKLAAIIRRIDRSNFENATKIEESRGLARDLLLVERRYRAEVGYETVVKKGINDHFIYRQGLLKKFVMSVLWLDISKEKEGKRIANVGAAIAAGVAMFFALVATIVAGGLYGINSWNFILAGVVTYILKDRIKDWLRIFFGRRFSRFIADYSLQVRDPIDNKKIGRCRESFSFIRGDDTPSEVLACRSKDAKSGIEAMSKPEVIMHYSKRVNLRGKEIMERMGVSDNNVNDIVRFSLSRFLARADDPIRSIPYYVEDKDRVIRKDFRKVYHINLVMVLESKDAGRTTLKRVRVIFDKREIREVQEVL